MAITGITTPNEYMHGYNMIPLKLADTNATNIAGYNYLVDIVEQDTYTSIATAAYTIGNSVYTEIEFSSTHNFKLGDTVKYGDNYFTVLALPTPSKIVIDNEYNSLITFTIVKLISRYKVLPDPNGYCKLDLSNTLKNYATQNFSDSNDIYAGPDSHFKCKIQTGYEGKAGSIDFTDNYFISGSYLGLVADISAFASLNIGDVITIQQDPLLLTYNDAYVYDINSVDPTQSGLRVAYILDDTVAIDLFGDATNKYTLQVDGQITYPDWNGSTTIFEPASSTVILSNLPTNVAVGTYSGEGGDLWSIPVPEYNTTTQITDLDTTTLPGKVIIATDSPWIKSTPAITGKLAVQEGSVLSTFTSQPEYDLNVYNAYINNKDWSINSMMDYMIQDTTLSGGPATILSRDITNRIEKSSKSWLLFHNDTTGLADGVKYQFYDVNNSLLATVYLENASGDEDDFYAPIGIDQIINATNKTDTTPLSSVVDDVDYYTVRAIKNYGTTFDVIGDSITLELNNDCSRFDLLHLIWKDAKGSWLSYPFKYVHTDSTEVSRSEYYKNTFNWDADTFDYKGNKSYFTRSRDKMVLNSGWVYDTENYLIRDLLVSADVYLQDENGNILGCQILNTDLTYGSAQKDQIYQYSLEIKLSNDEIRL